MKRARIQNFRCLVDAEITFDGVTSIIGPNGVGKSTVLRALDWFFNGDKSVSLSDSDLCEGASGRKIRVEVEFDSLTEIDRHELGRYAPPSVETFVVWRTWEDGEDKITGKGLAFPSFEIIRGMSSATEKRKAYNALREEIPDLKLPSAGSAQAVETALLTWERQNSSRLEECEIEGTNFFGFAGQSKLASLYEFILVSADLRALEESADSKVAIFGRILERAIDRRLADAELADLDARVNAERSQISARNFGPQLDRISKELTEAVGAFSTGRDIKVSPVDVPSKPSKAAFRVSVLDRKVETGVERQGHGFQRALIISALKLLSDLGPSGRRSGAVCLAIEEPELYQHPVQARAFASVLRKIAEDADQNAQVAYATHSPVFVEPRYFHEVRRISRISGSVERLEVSISHVSIPDVIDELSGYIPSDRISRQLENACLNKLSEALFASAVILVEGTTDKAVFEGCAERHASPLAVDGIHVADAGNKPSLLLSRAVLKLLGIPCYVVFDGDVGVRTRMESNGRDEVQIRQAVDKSAGENLKMLRYLGGPHLEWPTTHATEYYAVFADRIEECLKFDWVEWGEKVDELVASDLGYSGKNSFTYHQAARTARSEPPAIFREVLEYARRLSG